MRVWAVIVFVAWICFSTSISAQCDFLEDGVDITAAELNHLAQIAEQGNPVAQNGLGVAYYYGCVVERDRAVAARWSRLAAEQGYIPAQVRLGQMLVDGDGVPRDQESAVEWFRLAAEQGNPLAQAKLGVFYMLGTGVPEDFVIAHKWLNLAGAQGDTDAVKLRMALTVRMTPDQISEAQRLARDWYDARREAAR